MEKKVLLKDLVDFGTHLRKEITSKVRVSDQGVYPIGEIWDANTVIDVIVNGAHDAHDTLRELDQYAHHLDDIKVNIVDLENLGDALTIQVVDSAITEVENPSE